MLQSSLGGLDGLDGRDGRDGFMEGWVVLDHEVVGGIKPAGDQLE